MRSTALLVMGAAVVAVAPQAWAGAAEPALAPASASALQESQTAFLNAAADPARFAALARSTAFFDVSPAAEADENTPIASSSSSEDLPDAPSALGQDRPLHAAVPPARATQGPVAPKLTKYIPSGWSAQPLTEHDKFYLGLRDLYSPLNFLAMVLSAGYEHALNGEPNYGTDKGAFGQRLGAAAIRESTQGFFTDSVFSPLLRQDPRYYIEGPQYNFFHRLVYAGTRPLISRTDSGRSTVNSALLLGYAASSALSYSYYPQINRNFHDTASTFGGALGGAAIGFVVSEFSDQVLQAFHMEKKQ